MRTHISASATKGPRRIGRVVVIGDSHIHAMQEALNARGSEGTKIPITVQRLFKVKQIAQRGEDEPQGSRSGVFASALRFLKGGRQARGKIELGDISFDQALKLARSLRPDDVLVSVIGGNQHAVFSTIQHPRPFDFMLPDYDAQAPPEAGTDLVPFRALYPYFRTALRDGDGKTIAAFCKSTSARIIHLVAPPPKRMNEWIEQHHDTLFVAEGLARQGVSRPELRLKFWRLQNRAIEEICTELGVEVLGPPPQASDADGYLARPYYAGDATHANPRYGELVLQQLEAMLGEQVTAEETAS